ncbi:MAG: hypothetical protein Kow0063_14590 [Anaerolineae bacterium]
MNKQTPILAGTGLVILGLLALILTTVVPRWGLALWFWGPWRMWPLLVVGLGLLLVLPPVLMRRRPGLGLLFIPGLPLLTTGAILLLASTTNWWGVWEWLWPQEVLALGLGFAFAAAYARRVWLAAPAIIIGLNGLLFQFCALTGLWEAWAVLWTIEPLSIGLALLVVSAIKHSTGLMVSGLVVCGLAGLALAAMTTILTLAAVWPGLWLVNLAGAAVIILTGLLLIAWGLITRRASPGSVLELPQGPNQVPGES